MFYFQYFLRYQTICFCLSLKYYLHLFFKFRYHPLVVGQHISFILKHVFLFLKPAFNFRTSVFLKLSSITFNICSCEHGLCFFRLFLHHIYSCFIFSVFPPYNPCRIIFFCASLSSISLLLSSASYQLFSSWFSNLIIRLALLGCFLFLILIVNLGQYINNQTHSRKKDRKKKVYGLYRLIKISFRFDR